MVDFFQTKTISLFLVLFTGMFAYGQNPQVNQSGIRIMFYNVENLFHPTNDSIKNDDEILEYITDPEEIFHHYQDIVDIVIDGGMGKNIPSTIIEFTTKEPLLIREGLGPIDIL